MASRSRSLCRPGGFGATVAGPSSRPRRRAGGPALRRARAQVTLEGPLFSSCCGVPDFRCTYRLQLSEQFGFRAARELGRSGTSPSSGPLTVSVAVAAGAARNRARLRRRRSDSHLGELGGEASFARLRRRAGGGLRRSSWTRPNHRAVSEAETRSGATGSLRAKFFDWIRDRLVRASSTSTSSRPCASEDFRVFGRHAREDPGARA